MERHKNPPRLSEGQEVSILPEPVTDQAPHFLTPEEVKLRQRGTIYKMNDDKTYQVEREEPDGKVQVETYPIEQLRQRKRVI